MKLQSTASSSSIGPVNRNLGICRANPRNYKRFILLEIIMLPIHQAYSFFWFLEEIYCKEEREYGCLKVKE